MKRIVFMGTAEFAVPTLKALFEAGHDVEAVVTVPDKPSGRGLKVKSSPVKEFAVHHEVTILQPESLKDDTFQDRLAILDPDLFVVVAFRILPPPVIGIPKMGAINLHASLLPQYRGAAPINWAIINGEKETGVTTFFIKEKVDTGDVLMQKSTPIGDDETAGELHDRLMLMGAELVVKTIERLEEGTLLAREQPRVTDLKSAPKIFPEDCEVKSTFSCGQAHNFIRGLSPTPGAWLIHQGKRLKLLQSAITAEQHRSAESVFASQDHLYLKCSDGTLELIEVQPEGKRKMRGEEYIRGQRAFLPIKGLH